MQDPTQRFSNRVADYVRYRPHYPEAIIDFLRTTAGLRPGQRIADLGSGTGILSRLFLTAGNLVEAVEPNRAMAAAAEAALGEHEGFHSLPGTAEATGLAAASVDGIVAGQAFHWFDVPATAAECRRILKPGGWAALIWNDRRTVGSPFLVAYEQFLCTWGSDYQQVSCKYQEPAAMARFFGSSSYQHARFDNVQVFDLVGLRGRLCSSSYAPAPGHPRHAGMLAALAELFAAHAEDGQVTMAYDTEVYCGGLQP